MEPGTAAMLAQIVDDSEDRAHALARIMAYPAGAADIADHALPRIIMAGIEMPTGDTADWAYFKAWLCNRTNLMAMRLLREHKIYATGPRWAADLFAEISGGPEARRRKTDLFVCDQETLSGVDRIRKIEQQIALTAESVAVAYLNLDEKHPDTPTPRHPDT